MIRIRSRSWLRLPTPHGSEVIRSLRNPRVAAVRKLQRARERRATGLTLLEGPNVITAAVAAGVPIETMFACEDDPIAGLVPGTLTVSEDVLRAIAPTRHPRGPVATMRIPPVGTVRGTTIVAWGVSDPGNLGTIIRSCAAFDVPVMVGGGGTDPWSPKALRAAAGGHFVATMQWDVTVDELRKGERRVAAALPRGGRDPRTLPSETPWAVLVGEEAGGLPAAVITEADEAVTIPTCGAVESLNVAIAASILAYELSRRSGH